MKPSQKIDAANPALTVVSERSRSPNDLLNRALAHINYRHFDIGSLTIFEDPAIVVLNLFPKAANDVANENRGTSKWSQLRQYFSKKRQGILVYVKVSSLDNTKRNFAVRYIIENVSNSNSKQQDMTTVEALPETLLIDMFEAIPDVSLRKLAV